MGDEQRSITSLKTTAKEWARKVGIDSVDRLNEMIDSGKGLELILVCEAMQSNCMYEIARKVSEQKRRIILISGPSSAGQDNTFPQTQYPASCHGTQTTCDSCG